MADFRTHVTTSSVLGVGYAGMGLTMGFSLETSLVAGGLCGVSGMLPDLDSDTGIPIRESMGFAAGIVPMLLVDRFQAIGMPYDRMVLITAVLYFLIRFAGASLLGRFSVHRGMFHSIPAALTFAGAAFLICGPSYDEHVRYLKAGAVFFGVMSHLFLDELYSIEWKGGMWRFKRSFGTALKLWGKNGWANFSCYAKLAIVCVMVAGESSVMHHLEARYPELAGNVQRIHDAQEHLIDNVRDRVTLGGQLDAVAQPPARGLPSSNTVYPDRITPPSRDVPADVWPQTPAPRPSTPGAFTPNAGRAQAGTTPPHLPRR
jgi:membrane-bound metal-dependent hydrolase YbcI (DUF457 family)